MRDFRRPPGPGDRPGGRISLLSAPAGNRPGSGIGQIEKLTGHPDRQNPRFPHFFRFFTRFQRTGQSKQTGKQTKKQIKSKEIQKRKQTHRQKQKPLPSSFRNLSAYANGFRIAREEKNRQKEKHEKQKGKDKGKDKKKGKKKRKERQTKSKRRKDGNEKIEKQEPGMQTGGHTRKACPKKGNRIISSHVQNQSYRKEKGRPEHLPRFLPVLSFYVSGSYPSILSTTRKLSCLLYINSYLE